MITVTELFENRVQSLESNGKYKSLEMVFLVKGVDTDSGFIYINGVEYPATSEHFALEAVREHTPVELYRMARRELRIVEKINDDSYKIAVSYDYRSIPPVRADDDIDAGDRTITFSSSSGTRKITHSYQTVAKVGDTRDFKGAINVDQSNNVAGVDVLSPILTFSETHYMTYRKFKISYIRTLNSVQGRINSKAFRGFERGEVRFDGFSATRRGTKRDDLYEIIFQFSVIPNQEATEVQGLTVPAKLGWDYVWYRPKPVEDGGQVASEIEGIYVERIYQFADFGALQIKTTPFTPDKNQNEPEIT